MSPQSDQAYACGLFTRGPGATGHLPSTGTEPDSARDDFFLERLNIMRGRCERHANVSHAPSRRSSLRRGANELAGQHRCSL
eukprot:11116864-Lingulodinium_polyedra.AAC.1